MALFRGLRPLKRWRYVGIFCEELCICAASVRVGWAGQTFWAVLERDSGALHERTRLLPRASRLDLTPGGVRIADGSVAAAVELEEEDGIQAMCPNGSAYVWTHKQAGVPAHGTVSPLGGREYALDGLAVIDDTAGYHARVTEWRWAAGVGVSVDGKQVAFNLVEGINDPSKGSERAVWVDGAPHEVGAVSFSDDLSSIVAQDGSQLRFHSEAERRRCDNLLLVRSEYRAPFGSFSGTLPGGIVLQHALGVVEHHRARW